MVNKHNLAFPVLMDKNNNYADQLGIAITLSEKLQKLYTGFGLDLHRFNGYDTWKLPLPARFLVDSEGIIRSTEVHPDHTVRPEPTDIIDFLTSLK